MTVAFYLIAQMVGAGQLIQLLFGLPYLWAVVVVGVLMVIYVTFGGMIATTWVQIIKAGLLLIGSTLMSLAGPGGVRLQPSTRCSPRRSKCIAKAREDPAARRRGRQSDQRDLARHGAHVRHRRSAAHPHALLHRRRRQGGAQSVFWATSFIGYFYILTFIIGFGAIVLVATNPIYHVGGDIKAALLGGGNMAASISPMLSAAI